MGVAAYVDGLNLAEQGAAVCLPACLAGIASIKVHISLCCTQCYSTPACSSTSMSMSNAAAAAAAAGTPNAAKASPTSSTYYQKTPSPHIARWIWSLSKVD
eukprot:GHUV01056093.1.p2 GENE.GHUV01056093.1~~GHUV01056093.1.p2  ORF type:complete len:101 (-),score=8.78 GHUV01056093.1:7-309(-)